MERIVLDCSPPTDEERAQLRAIVDPQERTEVARMLRESRTQRITLTPAEEAEVLARPSAPSLEEVAITGAREREVKLRQLLGEA